MSVSCVHTQQLLSGSCYGLTRKVANELRVFVASGTSADPNGVGRFINSSGQLAASFIAIYDQLEYDIHLPTDRLVQMTGSHCKVLPSTSLCCTMSSTQCRIATVVQQHADTNQSHVPQSKLQMVIAAALQSTTTCITVTNHTTAPRLQIS